MDRRAVLGLGAVSLGLAAGAAGAAGAQGRDGQDAGGGPEPAVQVLSGGRPEYGPALAAIGRLVERHRQAFGLPGMTVSVADADGFAAVINAGWADADRKEAFTSDRLVQIGSISKSLVGLCIFRQIQAGRVALATPMRDILPDVPWPDGTPITLGHLLNHSSGLPDDAPVFPRGGDGRLWRGYEPGSSWSYSNTGYHLLGWTLERLHGRSLPEVIEGEALAPLGMAGQAVGALRAEDRHRYAVGRSPYVQDLPAPTPGRLGQAAWVDSADGAGCVAATSAAMTAYVRWLIGAARGHGGALLDDAHAARFCAPGVDAPGWGMPGARYAHGLAVVQAGGRTYLHHTGGMIAFNSSLHVDGAAGVGAFASTNVGLIVYRPRAVTAYACEALSRRPRPSRNGRRSRPPIWAPIAPPPARRSRSGGRATRRGCPWTVARSSWRRSATTCCWRTIRPSPAIPWLSSAPAARWPAPGWDRCSMPPAGPRPSAPRRRRPWPPWPAATTTTIPGAARSGWWREARACGSTVPSR